MRLSNPAIRVRAGALGILAVLLANPLWAAAAPQAGAAGESAVWAPKQLRFVFMGFTTHYSCDGLADKMRQVLLQLGARSDLKVEPVPCSTPYGRPDPFPGVTVKMNVLEPTQDNGNSTGSAAIVPAHWKTVSIDLSRDPVWAAGQCELVEQIKDKVLPKFTTRNVHYTSNCIPHQLEVGGTTLRADVLVADNGGTATPGAPAPATTSAPGTTAPTAGGVYVYPRNGQSATQTQSDREECHRWAVSQSGYDPTRAAQQPSGNAADYRRAMIACLDARGYTAR
jgi:hypothetical protein